VQLRGLSKELDHLPPEVIGFPLRARSLSVGRRGLQGATRHARNPLRGMAARIIRGSNRRGCASDPPRRLCAPTDGKSQLVTGTLLQRGDVRSGRNRPSPVVKGASVSSHSHSASVQCHRLKSHVQLSDADGHPCWPMVSEACAWSLARAGCHSGVAPRQIQRSANRVLVRSMPLLAAGPQSLSPRCAMNKRQWRVIQAEQ
jgi:hypothetical protein